MGFVFDFFDFRKNFRTEEEDEIDDLDEKVRKSEKIIVKLADLHDKMVDITSDVNECFAFEVSDQQN